MTRSKLINQFNELMDCIRVVYQNQSPNFRYFNGSNDVIFEAVQPIDGGELQLLFDSEIARIHQLTEQIKRQFLVFHKFSQFSMNVQKFAKFYDLVWLEDLRSILKQVANADCLDTQVKGKDKELKELDEYIESCRNLCHGDSQLNPTKLQLQPATDEPTEFDRKTAEWRKQLKKLNRETGEMMSLFRLLTNSHLICYLRSQNLINNILNFEKSAAADNKTVGNLIEDQPNMPTKLNESHYRLLKRLTNQTEEAVGKLVEETRKFEYDLFRDSLDKFNSLIEEELSFSEQIYLVLNERMHLDKACCERLKKDAVCYKQLVSKLPTDAAFLRSLKIVWESR